MSVGVGDDTANPSQGRLELGLTLAKNISLSFNFNNLCNVIELEVYLNCSLTFFEFHFCFSLQFLSGINDCCISVLPNSYYNAFQHSLGLVSKKNMCRCLD